MNSSAPSFRQECPARRNTPRGRPGGIYRPHNAEGIPDDGKHDIGLRSHLLGSVRDRGALSSQFLALLSRSVVLEVR